MPDGCFTCIEVKSGPRDFLTDDKWPEYRDYADALYFAVDADFPLDLLPAEPGLIVAAGLEAELLREAPRHPLPPPAAAPCCTASPCWLQAGLLLWRIPPAPPNSGRRLARTDVCPRNTPSLEAARRTAT